MKTKDRILTQAFNMFSEKGYKGTNLRELAASLDLTKSALYKHYKSKEDIFNSMVNEIDVYYKANFGEPSKELPQINSGEALYDYSLKQILFTINDERIMRIRKLLTLEQFSNEKIAEIATSHFITDIKTVYTRIFTDMMNDGIFRKTNAEMCAFEYTAPISLMIHRCDREPSNKENIIEEIKAFIKCFIENHLA